MESLIEVEDFPGRYLNTSGQNSCCLSFVVTSQRLTDELKRSKRNEASQKNVTICTFLYLTNLKVLSNDVKCVVMRHNWTIHDQIRYEFKLCINVITFVIECDNINRMLT